MNEILTLSKQEKRILTALSSGSLYKEIASDFSISINTVKKHLKNIYRKLSVNKRTKAIEKFLASETNDTRQPEQINVELHIDESLLTSVRGNSAIRNAAMAG